MIKGRNNSVTGGAFELLFEYMTYYFWNNQRVGDN